MEPPKVASPFVGLVPYTEDDARFFFGREQDQRTIIANLFASKLTLLYGPSAVGKSSLLRAGVIEELRRRRADREEDLAGLAVAYFNTWQDDPRQALRDTVRKAVQPFGDIAVIDRALGESSLADALPRLVDDLRIDLFVIFDQFEEYFLYRQADRAPDAFELEFSALAKRPSVPISFLLSLRDDAVSKLDRFRALIPNLFANYLRISHLGVSEARTAIIEPIKVYNALPESERTLSGQFTIEQGLVDEVVSRVRTDRIPVGDVGRGQVVGLRPKGVETPFLQLVMTALWEREADNKSTILRSTTLVDLEGVEGIVRRHLVTAIGGLNERERDLCAVIFQFLVTPSGTKIAFSAEDLAGLSERSAREIDQLLFKLSSSRLRVIAPVAPTLEGRPVTHYEISHDALADAILQWRRQHLNERAMQAQREQAQREAEQQRLELERVQALSEARRARAEAESQRAEAEQARANAEAGRAQEQARAARRSRTWSIALAVLSLFTAAAALMAWRFEVEARTAERKLSDVLAEAHQLSVMLDEAGKAAVTQIADLQTQLRVLLDKPGNEGQKDLLNKLQGQLTQLQTKNDALAQQLKDASSTSEIQKRLNEALTLVQTLKTEKNTAETQFKQQLDDEKRRNATALAQIQGDLTTEKNLNIKLTDDLKKTQTELSDLKAHPQGGGQLPQTGGAPSAEEQAAFQDLVTRYVAAFKVEEGSRARAMAMLWANERAWSTDFRGRLGCHRPEVSAAGVLGASLSGVVMQVYSCRENPGPQGIPFLMRVVVESERAGDKITMKIASMTEVALKK